ncbi:MAG: M6 family metalloprotease domain-containing protein [Paludibacter sp.]|nr:M6 family metalloprotease domain-containing protein [Paludibacter sp.]
MSTKFFYSVFTILIVVLFITTNIYAIKATPYPIVITQPDGSKITIRLHGDEFFKYKTTVDGYTLVENNEGILTYGQLDSNLIIKSTNVKANDIGKRSTIEKKYILNLTRNENLNKQSITRRLIKSKSLNSIILPRKTFPLTGAPKALVILVNFPGKGFVTTSPQSAFYNLLNQKGYNANFGTGSARDYFRDNSMGIFNPQFDVVGPFDLPQNVEFYGKNDSQGNDLNPQQMVIDACTLAASNGIDFSQYDTDKDGIVDNVFIYYAGYNEAEGGSANTIWPHRSKLNDLETKFNGVVVSDYACSSELRSYSGNNMCGIGTFCHEFGHVIGLPDYYPTNGATFHTLSIWDVMDSGSYLNYGRTPPAYSAFDRFYLNWMKPVELSNVGSYKLDILSLSNKGYLISKDGDHNLIGSNPLPTEFFMLEYRYQTGWDQYLPTSGMIITHINFDKEKWESNTLNNDEKSMGVDVIEADGIADDYTLNRDAFTATSKYNPILYDKTDLHKLISVYEMGTDYLQFYLGSNISIKGSIHEFSTVLGTPSEPQSFILSGKNLNSNLNITFQNGNFEMKKHSDPDTNWSKSIVLTPINSILDSMSIDLRYNPSNFTLTEPHSTKLYFNSAPHDYAEMNMSGKSTRPVYVVPPTAINATAINLTNFVSQWYQVYDAKGYYLTVYQVSDGESSLRENFNLGLIAPVDWTIANTEIYESALYSGESLPSIEMTAVNAKVETEEYVLPVTKLSFNIHSINENNASLLVEAKNDQNIWQILDYVPLLSTSNEIKTYQFDQNKAYNRFRFTKLNGSGSITFDDVTVGFSKKINYIVRKKWLTNTSDTITNLLPNTVYYYKVKASDKYFGYYENITKFSNEITVQTLPIQDKQKLLVTIDTEKNITIYVSAIGDLLTIYDLSGKCIKTIISNSLKLKITDLPRNQTYILILNRNVTKVVI